VLDLRPFGSQTVQIGPFALRVAPAAHPCEAYSIRVECAGASLVYTGDTAPNEALVELAAGADLLLSEASWTHHEDRPPRLHMSGVQAGQLAASAGVQRLLLTHVVPWTSTLDVLAEAKATFDGPVQLAATAHAYDVGGS
jgi:ribonuclease BN (tRNA processing enzyme)